MSSTPNTMAASFEAATPPAAAVPSPWQLWYWSVRRELWEHRSIYLAPAAIAGVILLGFLVVMFTLPHHVRGAMTLDPSQQRDQLATPFDFAAGLIMGAAFIVSIFYSLDALYGERRERSILFWKSAPVSDLMTVLAKASVVFLVLPAVAFAVTLATELVMLLLSSMVLAASGLSVEKFWDQLQLFRVMFQLLYHLVTVHVLWYAPLYGWFLLISAWAKRTPFLWVVLPPMAIGIFEKVAFHSSYFSDFLQLRFSGGSEAVDNMQGNFPMNPALHLTPLKFLATPGLWGGLVLTAIFLLLAARLRRSHGPI